MDSKKVNCAVSAPLYHAASSTDWAHRSATHYQPATYEAEGFIHFSSASQLLTPLHGFYRGRSDLILLTVDSSKFEVAVIWEDLYGGGEKFPHLYCPLNIPAIVSADPLPCDPDGRFDWWAEAANQRNMSTK